MDLKIDELFAQDPEMLELLEGYQAAEDEQEKTTAGNTKTITEENKIYEDICKTELPELEAEELQIIRAPAQKSRKSEIISNIIFYGILSAFLIACILFATSKNKQKAIFGFRLYNVLTESMTPKYDAGDMVIVKTATEASKIKKGDVVTLVPPGDRDDIYLTHRVQAISEKENGALVFTTKGDANKTADPFETTAENIIGKVVFSVPGGGGLISFIQKNLLLCIIFIASVFCFIILLKQLFKRNKA